MCRALPHFHKHLFSFRYCLRHHLNECEHAAGRVEYISFASVETEEDASPCVFWLIPRMNPYTLKSLHVQQQRQPSSEPSAACDEDAITPCGDSCLPNYFMPADECQRHLRSQLSRCWLHRIAEPFGHSFFFINYLFRHIYFFIVSWCRHTFLFISSLFGQNIEVSYCVAFFKGGASDDYFHCSSDYMVRP